MFFEAIEGGACRRERVGGGASGSETGTFSRQGGERDEEDDDAGRPVRNFRVLAAIVLVLSFATPFTIPGVPLAMVATLLLMHVVAAVVVVSILTTLARAR
ncbi:MAG: DUF6069 family protein [Actinobacteria bacterium]|nr:DUF6069 family protein [Actinomycetota bacterium]